MAIATNPPQALTYEQMMNLFGETNRMFQETDRKLQETKAILEKSSLETDRKFQETDRQLKETDRKLQETDRQMKETDKKIKELGKQIGGLGNKFGSYNEGLFMPSLVTMLKESFNCTKTSENFEFYDNGNSFEIDLFGISPDNFYIVEIKSHLTNDAIKQLIKKIEYFNKYNPEYSDKKKYGILVGAKYNRETSEKIIKNGIYLINTSDDLAKLRIPKDFIPKSW